MSDPSQAITSFMQRAIKKSRSETQNVDIIGTDDQEVEAGTLHDGEFIFVLLSEDWYHLTGSRGWYSTWW
jgi:hypothetical protein